MHLKTRKARKEEILKTIINLYIEHGEPVSSRAVSQLSSISLSPASIRSLMAELEDMEFLYQPHASSGRIPTDKGYRMYVDMLQDTCELSDLEKVTLRDHIGIEMGLDDLIDHAVEMLSLKSSCTGIALSSGLHDAKLHFVQFLRLTSCRILGLFIADDGRVFKRTLQTDEDYSEDELSRITNLINRDFPHYSLYEICNTLKDSLNEERMNYRTLLNHALKLSAILSLELSPMQNLWIKGASNLFNNLDFSTVEKMKIVMNALEEKTRLVELLSQCLANRDINVKIGAECQFNELSDFSIITSSYGKDNRSLGLLGVIGSKRMRYDHIIPLVDFTAELLTCKLSME